MACGRAILDGWIRSHKEFLTDLAVTLGLLIFAELLPSYQLSAYPNPQFGRTYGLLISVLAIPQILPLLFRRAAPVASLLIIVAASVAPIFVWGWQVQPGYAMVVAVAVGVYSVARHRPRPISLAVLSGWLLVALILLIDGPYAPWFWQILPSFIATVYLPAAAAWIAGDYLRRRHVREETLATEAANEEMARAELARSALTEQRVAEAAANERERIARELHDLVAHNMSVMVVHAGAARRILEHDPDEAARSIAAVETTGRQALSEMRRLLGVVRNAGADRASLAPQPSLEDLPSLLDNVRVTGIEVDMIVEGVARPLPQGLDLSVYRLIQEALTNTVRHAHAKRADIRLAFLPDALNVRITDDGLGLRESADASIGGGYGLVGLRERVAVFGGDLQSGNLPDGTGFFVAATFPLARS